MHPGGGAYKLMSHLIIHVFAVCRERGFTPKYWDLLGHWSEATWRAEVQLFNTASL